MEYNIQNSFIEIKSTKNVNLQQNINKFIAFSSINPQLFNNGNYNVASNTFTFNQNDNSFNSNFQTNRIIINFNNQPQKIDTIIENITNILTVVFSQGIYSHFNRVGIRIYIGYAYKSAKEINNIIKDKFLNMENLNKISDNIENLGIRFSTTINDFKVNCGFNPGVSQELKLENGVISNVKKTDYLILDLDLYKEGSLSSDDILKFCKDTKNNMQIIINKVERIL